ncbi:MAG: hypothetical protein PWQ71_471 [Bacteroidota bacterium]|jgi:hypothetical protein|nr:hypothetical protein [Bacteroidota bacterium]
MFKKDKAVHAAIYQDIVNNYKFESGLTFGQMEQAIDQIYRQKVEAYGLSDRGFYNDEKELNERASRELDEFFNKKISK